MPSRAQEDFFGNLLNDRDFGEVDKTSLMSTFVTLNSKSASTWIERALNLPKIDESKETITNPPF